MANITISEGLSWLKTLKKRQDDLIALRNSNSRTVSTGYGDRAAVVTQTPEYDPKKLDKRITLIARDIRLCESAIKKANATTPLQGYTQDDSVLGELED